MESVLKKLPGPDAQTHLKGTPRTVHFMFATLLYLTSLVLVLCSRIAKNDLLLPFCPLKSQ